MSADPVSFVNIRKLLQDRLFKVPDYQRGYAWETKQWDDLSSDLSRLLSSTKHHPMGTICLQQTKESKLTYMEETLGVRPARD